MDELEGWKLRASRLSIQKCTNHFPHTLFLLTHLTILLSTQSHTAKKMKYKRLWGRRLGSEGSRFLALLQTVSAKEKASH